jgi:hypothetical protein
MAKGILEFDLNEPDDILAHKRAVKATDMAIALFQFGHNTKKGHEWKMDKYETKEDLLDAVYEQFWEILDEHNIRLDDIIN